MNALTSDECGALSCIRDAWRLEGSQKSSMRLAISKLNLTPAFVFFLHVYFY